MNALVHQSDNHAELSVLSEQEVEEVSGALVPLVVAVWYAVGFCTGLSAGWAFGRVVWP